ncbi:MAG: heavy metal translocating P-type ATPase, partial [Clostridia bacterium]|nr:heavy metal translocating P-type ATPase [Clostridia bacterium]
MDTENKLKLTKKQKKELIKLIVSAVLLIAAAVFFATVPLDYTNPVIFAVRIAVFAGIYLIAGFDIIKNAFRGIFSGDFLDEQFLMTVASVAAFFIGEYVEGVAIIVLYGIGELFQNIAVGRSRKRISAIAALRTDVAHVLENGEITDLDPEEVAVGSIIEVRPGEKIPIDGVVTEGFAGVDTSSLTGESNPVSVSPGDTVFGGTISTDGRLIIKTTKPLAESSQEKVIALVEEAAMKKSKTERFITKFARIYTPCVVIAAVLIALIPSLITGDPVRWIRSAIVFLVVSCPCALVISIPMAFFAGVGKASKSGVLVKGAEYLERLADAKNIVMDKTGTITSGTFEVKSVTCAEGVSEERLLKAACTAESASNHPLAAAIADFCGKRGISAASGDKIEFREYPGKGVTAVSGEDVLAAGNIGFAREIAKNGGKTEPEAFPGNEKTAENNVFPENALFPENVAGTAVYVFENGKYLGLLTLGDTVKPGSREAVLNFKKLGVERVVMLSGDAESECASVAEECGLDDYKSRLLPGDKVTELENIISGTGKTT